MNEFTLCRNLSKELKLFQHIREFALIKISTVNLNSFVTTTSDSLQIFCILEGKFDWVVNQRSQVLYPGDVALVLPGQEIGGTGGFLEIGSLFRLSIQVANFDPNTGLVLGDWSSISERERTTVEKILLRKNVPVIKIRGAAEMLFEIRSEIIGQDIGYLTRVNQLIDSLLIAIARQSTRQADARKDFSRTFMDLEKTLRLNLSRQWTVEEMAALFGLGTTAFTEKVKNYTGFSPLNYLINIRISEAIKLLKRQQVKFTDIALETGFYSSQHFSTTFKKLTGYTPGQFRKRNTRGTKAIAKWNA